jgi:prepilin-type N-terminal cleavage/methylation domain-containing protein
MRDKKGFTLIELLVVITVILILMSLLAVFLKGVTNRARYKKTEAIISTLKMACERYKTELGGYPSATVPFAGSMNLHFCLGREWYERKGVDNNGGGISSKKQPFVEFKADWLEGTPSNTYPNPPRALMDAWERIITYSNPNPSTPTLPSFRIVSQGNDVSDPSDDSSSDVRDN